MVFHSQFEAVERPTPRDRIGSGKISPMTIHAPGPHVEAKKTSHVLGHKLRDDAPGMMA
jgi:hypothetical protein